jgi:hypothetical protein
VGVEGGLVLPLVDKRPVAFTHRRIFLHGIELSR